MFFSSILAASTNPIEIIFGAIERGLGSALAGIYAVIPSYGFALILLTIGIRLVLFPIYAKSTKSMRKMQQLQPHMKKLQAKYKDDRARLSQEQMALFKANKVSPISGCLPLILQMPILFAMFRVIGGHAQKTAKGAVSISFIPSGSSLYKALIGSTLATPTAAAIFLGMNLGASPLDAITSPAVPIYLKIPYVLTIAAIVATGWYQQKQIQAKKVPGAPEMPQAMQSVTKIMPIFFGVLSLTLPTGVNVYFLTSNLFQIGQQYLMFRNRGGADDVVIPTAEQKQQIAQKRMSRTSPVSKDTNTTSGAKSESKGAIDGPKAQNRKRVPQKVQPGSKTAKPKRDDENDRGK